MEEKINFFFDLLNQRTIEKIENTNINKSCTATLLLGFAVIDSLSKITCPDDQYELFRNKKGNQIRFKGFLENVMGGNYGLLKDELYDLRNDIVHTGINTKVVLSKSAGDHHLKKMNGYLWVNTVNFLDDLKRTIERIKEDIEANGQYLQYATNRLRELNIIEVERDPMPSPGPDDSPFQ